MRKLLFLFFFCLGIVSLAEAQVSAGINFQNTRTFITVGSDTDKEFFGEGRLGLGDDLGLELMGGYNFVRKSEVNAYFGLSLGLFGDDSRKNDHDHDDVYLAIPFGVLIKPFNTKNFGFLIEAAPVFADDHDGYLRGGIGFKYTFR